MVNFTSGNCCGSSKIAIKASINVCMSGWMVCCGAAGGCKQIAKIELVCLISFESASSDAC